MNEPHTDIVSRLIVKGMIITFVVLCHMSCASGEKDNQSAAPSISKSTIDLSLTGEELFVKNCKLCHGINGQLQLNGAKDLRESVMTLAERQLLIKEGKNAMTPFKRILSDEEILKVAEYSLSFKKTQ